MKNKNPRAGGDFSVKLIWTIGCAGTACEPSTTREKGLAIHPDLESVLREECRLAAGRTLVVGVSGGPDSLTLLDVLRRAGYPLVVAHFNHRLRPEAEREVEAVERRAQDLGLPFETEAADVAVFAAEGGLSVEEAARTLRYRFLFAAARRHSAQAVAVGHTADDQVETVLMHLLRGAGLTGLKGMTARTLLPVFDAEIPLVRPLLGWWRAETEAYCRRHALQPSLDKSNQDPTYFRNRLRLELIPELERLAPQFKARLLRTSQALQGDHALLEEVVDAAWERQVPESGPGWVAFDRAALAAAAPGLRRALILRAAGALRPESRDFGFDAVSRLEALLGTPAGRTTDFANRLYCLAEGERLYLAAAEADLPSAQWPQVDGELRLALPGRVELGNGWVLSAQAAAEAREAAHGNADPYRAWLDADRAGSSLTVRAARPGERMQPLGMRGQSLKISDLYVNVKLTHRARKKWPVVFAGEVPAWVPGLRLAEPFRLDEATQHTLCLVLEKA